MKKKLLVIFLAIVSVLALAFGLTACGGGNGDNTEQGGNNENDSHIHTYAPEWTYDATHHWHASTCSHTAEVSDKAEHAWGNGFCTVCGKKDLSVPEGLEYTLSNDETNYSVTGIGTCTGKELVIPSTYNDKPVISIGYGAFSGCSSLTSITIPDSVISIGNGAFSGCSSLTNVSIPDSVTSIGSYAFFECSSLTSVQVLGYTYVGSEAFSNVGGNITFDKYNQAATGWSSAWNVGFNGTITYLAEEMSQPTYTEGLSFKLQSNGTYSVSGYNGSETEVVIPELYQGLWVTSIGDNAFYYRSSLTSVTIPDSVTSIGFEAFFGCSSLTSVTIGNSVTTIFKHAFYCCSSLTSITIPDSVTSIGDCAFYDCSGLTSVTIPDSVTSIGSNAFYGTAYYNDSNNWENNVLYIGKHLVEANSSLSGAYTIKDGTLTIAISAFSGCSSLTNVTIPDSVTSIGSNAFYGCSGLTSILVDENNHSYKSIDGDLYTKDGTTIIQYAIGKTAKTFEIPDSVTSIGDYAFCHCSSLTSVTIPDSVISIGKYAFRGCSSLESITIPFVGATKDGTSNTHFSYIFGASYASDNSTCVPTSLKTVVITGGTSIDKYAFYGCSGLTSITIPNSVTSIGNSAFYGCTSLTSVSIPDSVTSIGDYAFGLCRSLTSVTIPDSVTSIGDYAFEDCRSLTSILIPDSVTSIGEYAFSNCSSLTSITIGNGVTSIGTNAFSNCSSLTSVTIGNRVTSIGSDAFNYCYKLIEVKNLSSLNIIAGSSDYGYVGCYAKRVYSEGESYLSTDKDGYIIYDDGTDKILVAYTGTQTDLTLSSEITQINQFAFSNCSSLTSVTIPDGVTCVGAFAFYGCSSLTSVTIGNSVTTIFEYAFYGCSGLTSITIPDSVTCIGSYAFNRCSSLTSVTLANTNGWWVTEDFTVTSGTSIASTDLANPSTAATYLKSTYYYYYWKRS